MKKLRKNLIIQILLSLTFILLFSSNVFANNIASSLHLGNYSDDFKNWLELSEKEKQKIIQPRLYNITSTDTNSKNPFFRALRSYSAPYYHLKNVIPNNLVIRDQMQTNSCWTFAALSSLETNLAMADYKKGSTAKIYDYSERHMEYATSKTFANNVINPLGYNREVGSGSQWYAALSYLTNGQGAISESDMPFQDNENIINISEIQNKTVASQLYDTIDFPNYLSDANASRKAEIIESIKQHIQNYGSVFASIHGNSSSTTSFPCYNNTTGAKYCNTITNHLQDHAVSIVGWDDNYAIDNFAEGARPTNKGAWIVRNSWGTRQEISLSDLKEEIFTAHQAQCIANGWSTAAEIPNAFIESNGFTIENDIAYVSIGDNGFIYVSYEDVNIAKTLFGIEKATGTVNYDNIYQYDEYYPATPISYPSSKIFLGNLFNKKSTNKKEYITQVSIYAPETYTCKVYVNPNGSSKEKKDLQLVPLKSGNSETIAAGYHTLEFATPVEIKASQFFVVIEITTNSESSTFLAESTQPDISAFDVVRTETGKCFFTIENSTSGEFEEWVDLGSFSELSPEIPNSDSSIKAFTILEDEDTSLNRIEIVTPPTKINYYAGENFNSNGMVVRAYYNNNTSKVLNASDYSITNGTNLVDGQTSVTITFEGKSVTQTISVTTKPEDTSLNRIEVVTPPTKVNYYVGENFNSNGMVIRAYYNNNTSKVLNASDYSITNGTNLVNGQTSVTITFEGKSVTQAISVTTKSEEPSNPDDPQKPDEPSKPDEPTPDKDEAKSSDFNNAAPTVKKATAYYYTKNAKNNYVLVQMEINQINRALTNDSVEYYYYLSPNANETNISNWIKITEKQTTNNQLRFEIDSRKVTNFADISNSNTLYLYLKEVATKGEDQRVLCSQPLSVESDIAVEVFIDGIKKQDYSSNPSTPSTPSDGTTAPGKIPQTGIKITLSVFIIVSLLGGLVFYIRYQRLINKMK